MVLSNFPPRRIEWSNGALHYDTEKPEIVSSKSNSWSEAKQKPERVGGWQHLHSKLSYGFFYLKRKTVKAMEGEVKGRKKRLYAPTDPTTSKAAEGNT
jgi:hypothetical protein